MSQTITTITNLLVIDSQVSDWQSLASAATPGTAVLILDSGSDGLTQISDYLTTLAASTADFVPLQSIQIMSHGSAGSLLLGSSTITQDNVSLYSEQLANMGSSLTDTGDILLYGCDVAADQNGVNFINQLAALTNADVAASNDLTGSAALGGDWQLEAATGSIEAASAVNTETLAGYTDTLRIADTDDAAQFTGSEAVLTIWNTTQEKSFSLDLGLQQSAFLADTTLARTWNILDTNLTNFLAGNGATDNIIYSVVSGSSSLSAQNAVVSGGIYDGLTKKVASLTGYGLVTTSSNTLDEFKVPLTNSAKIGSAITSVYGNNVALNTASSQSAGSDATNASVYAATAADPGYADTAFGTNIDGKLGSFNIFADQASALDVFRASLNPALPSQTAFAQFGQYNLNLATGTLTYGAAVAANNAPTTSLVTLASIVEHSPARVITQLELLGNAKDLDVNDHLTATGLSITSGNGTLVDNADGTWSYKSVLNDISSVSFSYTITDSVSPVAGTVAAIATLDITPVNATPEAGLFKSFSNGVNTYIKAEDYVQNPGQNLDLKYQIYDKSPDAIVIGSTSNDYINMAGTGNKAANGGGGNDVIDGTTGSSFLSGGDGIDTFFLDGRAAGVTWSTLTDFTQGQDKATIWGWVKGVSTINAGFTDFNTGGATDYTGLTLHIQNLLPDGSASGATNSALNSLTLTGHTLAQFGASSLRDLNTQIINGTNTHFIVGQTTDDLGVHGFLSIS